VILVDTNVFVDVWSRDPAWAEWSEAALARAAEADTLAVNPMIYAELSVGFREERHLLEVLSSAGVRRLPLPYRAAWMAARAFSAYRRRGGKRTSPLPDFFIGAHAQAEGHQLLTRDPTRIRTYFPDVTLVSPE